MANCNQCEKQCPKDALKCGRGRAYFGMADEASGGSEWISLLRKCGHMLHHGEVPEEIFAQRLSEEEQIQLVSLLQKLF